MRRLERHRALDGIVGTAQKTHEVSPRLPRSDHLIVPMRRIQMVLHDRLARLPSYQRSLRFLQIPAGHDCYCNTFRRIPRNVRATCVMARPFRTDLARSGGLESNKTPATGEVFVLDFPLDRTYQDMAEDVEM